MAKQEGEDQHIGDLIADLFPLFCRGEAFLYLTVCLPEKRLLQLSRFNSERSSQVTRRMELLPIAGITDPDGEPLVRNTPNWRRWRGIPAAPEARVGITFRLPFEGSVSGSFGYQ